MIVDTHVHVVSDNREKYPPADKAPAWPPTTGENLVALMDEAGIDHALLVQSYFTYRYNNVYMMDVARAYPERFLSVCVLDPLASTTPDMLTYLVRRRGVRGVRLMNDRAHNIVSIDDPRTFPLWERIAALDIPVCIASLIDDVSRLSVPLGRFPDVRVAIDHIWGLKVDAGPTFNRIKPVLELAHHPNLYVKIAPNNSFAVREAKATPRDFYGLLVERFGAKRLMWGTNYPAHRDAYGSLKERMELGMQDLSFLDAQERRFVFGETALSLWPGLRRRQIEKETAS